MDKPRLRQVIPYRTRSRFRERIPDRIREEVVSIFSKPKRTPIEHWRWVLSEAPMGSLAETSAREALAKLGAMPDRVPGEDDE